MTHFSFEHGEASLIASPRASHLKRVLGVVGLALMLPWAVFVTLRALEAIPAWRPVPFEGLYDPFWAWSMPIFVASLLIPRQQLTLTSSCLLFQRWLGPMKLAPRSWEIGSQRFAVAKWPYLLTLVEPGYSSEFPPLPLPLDLSIPHREAILLVEGFNRFLDEPR